MQVSLLEGAFCSLGGTPPGGGGPFLGAGAARGPRSLSWQPGLEVRSGRPVPLALCVYSQGRPRGLSTRVHKSWLFPFSSRWRQAEGGAEGPLGPPPWVPHLLPAHQCTLLLQLAWLGVSASGQTTWWFQTRLNQNVNTSWGQEQD